MDEDSDHLSKISTLAGLKTPLNDFKTISLFADDLKVLIDVEAKVPNWAVDAYYKIFQKYLKVTFNRFHANENMIKIRGGPLVTEIVNNMAAKADNSTEAKEFLIYSAHDVTIHSLAHALGVHGQIPSIVSYADAITVDLIDKGERELVVQVVYLDNSGAFPRKIPLNVPGCGQSCPLSVFKNAVAGMMVNSMDDLCKL